MSGARFSNFSEVVDQVQGDEGKKKKGLGEFVGRRSNAIIYTDIVPPMVFNPKRRSLGNGIPDAGGW